MNRDYSLASLARKRKFEDGTSFENYEDRMTRLIEEYGEFR